VNRRWCWSWLNNGCGEDAALCRRRRAVHARRAGDTRRIATGAPVRAAAIGIERAFDRREKNQREEAE